MKYSRQREAILNSVLWHLDHPTAEMVYKDVRKDIPNISLGTVYRDLNDLCESGQIKRVELPGNGDRYDKNLEHHNHVICEKCHKLYDVPTSSIEAMNKLVASSMGFEILSSDLVFKGICKDCRNK